MHVLIQLKLNKHTIQGFISYASTGTIYHQTPVKQKDDVPVSSSVVIVFWEVKAQTYCIDARWAIHRYTHVPCQIYAMSELWYESCCFTLCDLLCKWKEIHPFDGLFSLSVLCLSVFCTHVFLFFFVQAFCWRQFQTGNCLEKCHSQRGQKQSYGAIGLLAVPHCYRTV